MTPEYFRVTGVQPVLGRAFAESDAAPPTPVIVLGYELWQRKFNGDPNIVGKTMRMSRRDTPPTIIGVMPPGIRFLPSPAAAQEPNYNVNAVVDYLDARFAGIRQASGNRAGTSIASPEARRRASNTRRPSCGCSPPGRPRRDSRLRRVRSPRAAAHRRNEPRRPAHPVAALRRRGARAVDRLRQHRGAAAGARTAASAGIRHAQRARHRSRWRCSARRRSRACCWRARRRVLASVSRLRSSRSSRRSADTRFRVSTPSRPAGRCWQVASARRSSPPCWPVLFPAVRATRLDPMDVLKRVGGRRSSAGRGEAPHAAR